MKIINQITILLLMCTTIFSCTRDNVLENNNTSDKLNVKKLNKLVNDTIKRVSASEFTGWDNIPVNIISETGSNNKFLTFGSSNEKLTFEPPVTIGDSQKFYIKNFGTYVEIHGYPNSANQRYGLNVIGSGQNYSTFNLYPSTYNTSKWKLWNVISGADQQYLIESLVPTARINGTKLPIQSVLTANNSNNTDKKVYFNLYDKNNYQKFKIVPAEQFEFLNIDYDINSNSTVQMPDFISTATISNNTSIQQRAKMIFTKKTTESSTWKVGFGISATIGIESTLGIPLLVSGKFTFSTTFSATGEYGKTQTTEDSRAYEFFVDAPPKSVVRGKAIVKQYTANISYTARVRGKTSGRIINITGVWTGVASGEISYTIDEIELEDGTIQQF